MKYVLCTRMYRDGLWTGMNAMNYQHEEFKTCAAVRKV